MKPFFKALPDDEGVDRVELVVVDRYKQSGLSGDEWRTAVVIRMFRKGDLVSERAMSGMRDAAAALPWLMLTAHEQSPMPLWGLDEMRCNQYGCAEEAVEVVELVNEFSRQGEGPLPDNGLPRPRRAFCVKHRQRGDCSREDCDTNYVKVSGSARGKGA